MIIQYATQSPVETKSTIETKLGAASAVNSGYLSSTDWSTFNGKQAALGYTAENTANKNAANGYAGLDGSGKVAAAQLPSYVDDVIEAANFASLPVTGETGKIYITLDNNRSFRWSGSVYVNISSGETNLGYTASASNGIVTSDTGTDATIPAGSTTNASLMLPADKTKLDAITGTNTGDETKATIESKLGVGILSALLGADVTRSATSLANVGLSVAVEANSTYHVNVQIMFQTAATTTGIQLSQNLPAGSTVVANWQIPISLTADVVSNQRAVNSGTASTGVDTIDSNLLATCSMLVITSSTAGTLNIRYASEVGASLVTVKAGSNIIAYKVG